MSPDLSPLWVHAAARPISSLLIKWLTSNLQHSHIIQIGIQVERVRLLPNSSVYNQHMKSSSMLQKEPNMMPNRVRPSAGTYRNSYAGASGMRGNPWSNVSSQYPTPPKPPTSARKSQPPPPSSGAERYRKNFQTPQASAYQAAQEGPQARKNMYEGWENLRHPKTEHGPGKTWKTPQPPPRGTPTSGREESNARSQRPVPPRPAPAEGSSQRSHSSSAANRKGFMPNTPGGDEPPAPRGNYFTNRDKPSVAPDLPAREPSSSARYPAQDPSQNPFPDPLRSSERRLCLLWSQDLPWKQDLLWNQD